MTVADNVRKICAEARPHIEAMLDSAEILAGLRDVAKERGIDWSQLKALLKARIQDDRDGGQRVEKLISKADNACSYAAMLGSMAEKTDTPPQSTVSRETEPAVEISLDKTPVRDGETWPVESLSSGPLIEAAPPGGVGAEDGGAAMPVTGHSDDFLSIPEFLRRPLPEAIA